MNNIIETKDLMKSYGSKKALRGVNIKVPEGKIYGLLGPNGAGKTTMIGVLSGLIKRYSGKFSVAGTFNLDSISSMVGLAPQDADFYHNMSPMQHMMFFSRLQGTSKSLISEESVRLLKLVGLQNEMNTKSAALSHGMRRRLGLAQALIGNPKILILDEPTSGLDPSIAKSIRSLILELKKNNTTILFSSHNLYEVEEICDWIGILDRGKLVREGSMNKLRKVNSVKMSIENIKEEIIDRVRKKSYVKTVVSNGKDIRVLFKSKDSSNELIKFLVNHDVVINNIKKGDSLEDIFVGAVGKE